MKNVPAARRRPERALRAVFHEMLMMTALTARLMGNTGR